MIEIPYTQMKAENRFVWISNHYDIHLEGLCRGPDGKLWRFTTPFEGDDLDDPICTLHRLTFWQKLHWLRRKKLFEWCVGYHWTYPQRAQGQYFYYRRPRWLYRLLFKAFYRTKRIPK